MGSTDLTATQLGGSEASDASLCRVSGYIKDIHGNALPGREIVVRNIYVPAAVSDDTLILNEVQQVRSNSSGYVQFDLYQGATVRVELPGRLSEFSRTCVVPEETSIDLIGFIFPYLLSVVFDDDTLDVDVGEQFTPDITATLSNGEESESSLGSALTFSISDEDVLEHTGGLNFTALSSGTATITITEVDTDAVTDYQEPDGDPIERLSHPTITLDFITVTVT